LGDEQIDGGSVSEPNRSTGEEQESSHSEQDVSEEEASESSKGKSSRGNAWLGKNKHWWS